MKKLNLFVQALFLMGILFCNQVVAQGRIDLKSTRSAQECTNINDEGFRATFSFNGIEATEVSTEKGVFSNITMDNTYPTGMLGEPTLPAVNKLLAIPLGVNDITVEVKSYSTEVYSLADYGIMRLYPQQPLLRKDQNPEDLPFAYNEKAYTTKGFAERPIAEAQIQGTLRGIQIGALTVNPIQYDPATNSIRVYNDIEVEVSYSQYDKVASYNEFARTFSPYFAGIYREMFNWRDDVYDQHPDLWQAPVKMLVIADRMFEECMQEWLAWKTMKGFYVDVNYTDQIGNNANAIRTFIQEKYASDAPSFVMIMGDRNQVAPSAASGSQTQCVTDLYYMTVDNDEFADIFHSRFPAENVGQMTAMLNKALEYERLTMPDPSYLSNVLLIAGEDSGWGVTVGRPTIWYASNYYYNEEHGLANVYEYSHGTYNGCYNNLNTGVNFVNYTAHGSNTSWAGPQFTVSDVNSLTNEHKYFLAMGNCCEAADWGINGACFGEAMVRAENKAAYAYIGSCPSTYWLNDYYFGVGATSIANGTMPPIEQTTTGAYDAIWDNDSYNTVCAIPFIGNLAGNAAQALGYTLHIGTLYCWQAYHVLGDGSVMPYRVQPTANDVSHLPTLPIGIDFFNVTAAPGSYVAISKDGVLHGAGLIGSEGSADITIEPILTGGDVTICVTCPDKIPYITTIPAASLEGAYIVYNNVECENVVPGAYVVPSVTVKNVGVETAENVTVTLTTDSEYIEILNGTATIPSIAADELYTITDAFDFNIAVDVPNNTKAQFFITCESGENAWESKFNITLKAPDFVVESISNTEALPGGDAVLDINITNQGGADANNAILYVFSSSDDIMIENNTFEMEAIAAGETVNFPVNLTVASDVALGSTFELSYLLASGHYSVEGRYVITVGNITESFESGDFSNFPWTFSGSQNWVIDSNAHEGTFSAKSGTIYDNQQSDLILNVDVYANGEISFYRKVSSENSYDKLYFYIDDVQKDNWSGEQDWSRISYPVTVGNHTFKWSYVKDYSVSSGSDCAWIDDVQFPPTSVTVSLNPVTNLEAVVEGYDVTLNWNMAENATHYVVMRDGVMVADIDQTTHTETLEDGTYVYLVIAKDDAGHCSAPAYIKVNVGITGVEETAAVINVYPNPVKSVLNLNVNADYQYELFNNMGQRVMNGSALGQQQLNVSGLAKGLYVLRISTDTQIVIEKITIE